MSALWRYGALADDRPSLLCAGLGRGWWWPRRPVVADEHRVYVIDGGDVHLLPVPCVDQVGLDENGIVAVGGPLYRSWARFDGRVSSGRSGRERAVPGGEERVWVDEGFVYRSCAGRTRPVDVLEAGERLWVGPHGALLAGKELPERGAVPGRTPRPLPCALDPDHLRWSRDGSRICGIDERGLRTVVDLASGHVYRREGLPISVGAVILGNRVRMGAVSLFGPIAAASCARSGHHLAGPGGALWSLRSGSPVASGCVSLGLTVGCPDGFLTVDYETNTAAWLRFDGTREEPFVLPMTPEDTPVAGLYADGAVHLSTALGKRLQIAGREVTRSKRVMLDPPEPSLAQSPAGPVLVADTAEIEGRIFAWNDDGWLWTWPSQ